MENQQEPIIKSGDYNFIVIEAKYQDLNNGFKQLAMELITLDKLIEDKNKIIYGAVTIGTICIDFD